MTSEDIKYLKTKDSDERLHRVEVWLSPVLIIFPFIISSLLIRNWYIRGYVLGNHIYDTELILAIIIIIGNILFDIPFVKFLTKQIEK